LDICFGMGTTYRSLMSWGTDTTAVDLNPGVFRAFSFFYPDGESLVRDPRTHWVVDDGRRFLERTQQKFDVITIDRPRPWKPRVPACYIPWSFTGWPKTVFGRRDPPAMVSFHRTQDPRGGHRSLTLSFAYVRAYLSIEGSGYHFIASDSPLTVPLTKPFSQECLPTPERISWNYFLPSFPHGCFFISSGTGRWILDSSWREPRNHPAGR